MRQENCVKGTNQINDALNSAGQGWSVFVGASGLISAECKLSKGFAVRGDVQRLGLGSTRVEQRSFKSKRFSKEAAVAGGRVDAFAVEAC